MLEVGSSFADCTVEAVAGSGAMATTYRARRQSDGRLVALKVPNRRCLRDPGYVVRFLQEAALGARLQNRFIVQIYDSGEADGVPWIAMEFLEGMTLKEAVKASGHIPERRVLQIGHDLASALEHAHGKGVVHRDLKPENVMLRVGTCLKVMDFGIAKMVGEIGLTTSNMFIGSPLYAAPEMVDAKSVDHRVDLYSLGIILFEMLQGFPPFTGTSPVMVILAHRDRPLPALAGLPHPVSRPLWQLVEMLTSKDPAKRLPDARSTRIALEVIGRSV